MNVFSGTNARHVEEMWETSPSFLPSNWTEDRKEALQFAIEMAFKFGSFATVFSADYDERFFTRAEDVGCWYWIHDIPTAAETISVERYDHKDLPRFCREHDVAQGMLRDYYADISSRLK